MANYLVAFKGGGIGESHDEQQASMDAWMNWFSSLGDLVPDTGSPFGASISISSDGSVTQGGASALTGYSIVSADGIAEATEAARGCPILSTGGSVEVYEIMPMRLK